jgi:hypothetical protein
MADNRLVLRIYNAQQGHQAIQQALAHAKGWLGAGGARLVLEVRPETRSDAQNRLLHALFSDVSKQAEWMGQKRTAIEWKLLFVSGHSVATKQGADLVPGLEGEFLNLRESTARMGKARMASLLEYVMAWAIDHGVELREARQWVDAETGEVLA